MLNLENDIRQTNTLKVLYQTQIIALLSDHETHAWEEMALLQKDNHFLCIPVDRNNLSLKAMLMRISESQEQNGTIGICKSTHMIPDRIRT